jgi:hypothetical protein
MLVSLFVASCMCLHIFISAVSLFLYVRGNGKVYAQAILCAFISM